MKSEFKLDKEPVSCLIVGGPGSGKTSFVLKTFPKPYILDCDDNLRAAVEHTNITNFNYDIANKKDDGEMINDTERGPKTKNRYAYLVERITAAAADPNIETIVLDSLGTLSDILISEVKKQQSRKDHENMRIQDWGDFVYLVKNLIVQCKSTGKHLVATAHIDMSKDEADNKFKHFIHIPGQSKFHLPGLFGHCVLFYSDIKGVPPSTKEVRMVRTSPQSANDFRGLKTPYAPVGKSTMELADFEKLFKSKIS